MSVRLVTPLAMRAFCSAVRTRIREPLRVARPWTRIAASLAWLLSRYKTVPIFEKKIRTLDVHQSSVGQPATVLAFRE